MKPNVVDVNVATGEETVREMTDAEYADYLERQNAAETE